MMIGIFFVFILVQGFIFFGKRNIALALSLINLIFMVAMLVHHATTALQIRL